MFFRSFESVLYCLDDKPEMWDKMASAFCFDLAFLVFFPSLMN